MWPQPSIEVVPTLASVVQKQEAPGHIVQAHLLLSALSSAPARACCCAQARSRSWCRQITQSQARQICSQAELCVLQHPGQCRRVEHVEVGSGQEGCCRRLPMGQHTASVLSAFLVGHPSAFLCPWLLTEMCFPCGNTSGVSFGFFSGWLSSQRIALHPLQKCYSCLLNERLFISSGKK